MNGYPTYDRRKSNIAAREFFDSEQRAVRDGRISVRDVMSLKDWEEACARDERKQALGGVFDPVFEARAELYRTPGSTAGGLGAGDVAGGRTLVRPDVSDESTGGSSSFEPDVLVQVIGDNAAREPANLANGPNGLRRVEHPEASGGAAVRGVRQTRDAVESVEGSAGVMDEVNIMPAKNRKNSGAVRWCFTWNNYVSRDEADLAKFAAEYCTWMVYGHEVGALNTPHLQGYMKVEKPKRLTWLKSNLSGHVHFEIAGGTDEQNFKYCSKGENVVEYGNRPKFVTNGEREQNRWAQAILSCKAGRMDDIDPQIYISYYSNCMKIQTANQVPPGDLVELENFWFQGEPGTGKSTRARTLYGKSLFNKPMNKWWCGYQSEDNVLMDDFDHGGACLGHYLKIWGDKFPFTAEVKGSSRSIRPMRIVITSNYSISDIWPGDMEMQTALKRRYKTVRYKGFDDFRLGESPKRTPVFVTPYVTPTLKRQVAVNLVSPRPKTPSVIAETESELTPGTNSSNDESDPETD